MGRQNRDVQICWTNEPSRCSAAIPPRQGGGHVGRNPGCDIGRRRRSRQCDPGLCRGGGEVSGRHQDGESRQRSEDSVQVFHHGYRGYVVFSSWSGNTLVSFGKVSGSSSFLADHWRACFIADSFSDGYVGYRRPKTYFCPTHAGFPVLHSHNSTIVGNWDTKMKTTNQDPRRGPRKALTPAPVGRKGRESRVRPNSRP